MTRLNPFAPILFCLLVAFFACTGEHAPTNQYKQLIHVPLVRQATNYTCGAAAFQSVLGYYGIRMRENVVAKLVGSDSMIGTPYHNIQRIADSLGFSAKPQKHAELTDLKKLLDQKIPTIVLIQAWRDDPKADWKTDWIDGHYVVAVGYDAEKIYFMDPSTLGNYTFIPQPEFEDRWHDVDMYGDTCTHFIMPITRKEKPVYQPVEILKMD